MKAMIPTVPEKKISETENKQQYKNPRRPCGEFSAYRKKGKKIKNRHAGGHAPPEWLLERKPAVSRDKVSCGAGF